jgi:hypothetical protein
MGASTPTARSTKRKYYCKVDAEYDEVTWVSETRVDMTKRRVGIFNITTLMCRNVGIKKTANPEKRSKAASEVDASEGAGS